MLTTNGVGIIFEKRYTGISHRRRTAAVSLANLITPKQNTSRTLLHIKYNIFQLIKHISNKTLLKLYQI